MAHGSAASELGCLCLSTLLLAACSHSHAPDDAAVPDSAPLPVEDAGPWEPPFRGIEGPGEFCGPSGRVAAVDLDSDGESVSVLVRTARGDEPARVELAIHRGAGWETRLPSTEAGADVRGVRRVDGAHLLWPSPCGVTRIDEDGASSCLEAWPARATREGAEVMRGGGDELWVVAPGDERSPFGLEGLLIDARGEAVTDDSGLGYTLHVDGPSPRTVLGVWGHRTIQYLVTDNAVYASGAGEGILAQRSDVPVSAPLSSMWMSHRDMLLLGTERGEIARHDGWGDWQVVSAGEEPVIAVIASEGAQTFYALRHTLGVLREGRAEVIADWMSTRPGLRVAAMHPHGDGFVVALDQHRDGSRCGGLIILEYESGELRAL